MEILRFNKINFGLIAVFSLLAMGSLKAAKPEGYHFGTSTPTAPAPRAANCALGSSRFNMDINNVRCMLLANGDCWWDLANAQYVVPKVDVGSGAKPVSSIYAGAVWMGGYDAGHNLKLAGQQYHSHGGAGGALSDFWPGPLSDRDGTTTAATCAKWDKHWSVTRKDIETHLRAYKAAKAGGPAYDAASIPESVKGWPSQGNPYFFSLNRFELPNTTQGLAKYYDENHDGKYDPIDGDYPVIDVRGCEAPQYPDQMVFWIYNDNGNVHTESSGSTPIQMEVQVQAFAYSTQDELNDMTFQRYKLINRATQLIDSTYFAMWVDFDLGCATDDYIGCDTIRSLAYCYNQDAVDGTTGAVCTGGTNTYGSKIPIVGVDYFRGPRQFIYDTRGNHIRNWNNTEDSSKELGLFVIPLLV
jgi:hypothetical protein